MVGSDNANSQITQWKLVVRKVVSTYDIVNRQKGEYINPLSAANNQQLSTSANSPAKGWTFSAADTDGYYICTAEGGIQLHQANSGMGYKIINCGSGTNTSDAGCQFKVKVVDIENIPSSIEAVYSDSISDSEDVVIYDMLGWRVDNITSGFYIVNGTKMLVRL